MNAIHRRRLLLSLSKIKDFIIFDTALREGSVLSSSYSQISVGGYISVKGTTKSTTSNTTRRYSGDSYSSMAEVLASLGSQRDYVTGTSTQVSESGHVTYIVYLSIPKITHVGGNFTMGSYDFTKYKTLKFTVASYAASGSLSFGSETIRITAAGVYSIDIKDLEGTFDIKFSSDSSSGYTVNNVYLEG